MADKTLFQKMFLKPGMKFAVVDMPPACEPLYQNLPTGVEILSLPAEQLDVLQVFVRNEKELRERLIELKPLLKPAGFMFVCYPKVTSGVPTDINRDSIWKIAAENGLGIIANISVDETWTALRFKIIPS